jgi:hypothetical protein
MAQVATSSRQLMFECPALNDVEQLVQVIDQYVGCAGKLHGEAGIEHVGRRHPLMHEARFITDLLGDPGQEGDHIMFRNRFDRIDGGDIDGRVGRPPIPQRLGR